MGKLTEFTFKDSGITVQIQKISPMLAVDIAAAMPYPLPPVQEVDYGEPKGKVMEANLADPGYQKIIELHDAKRWRAWRDAIIKRGIVPTDEHWQEQVTEYRKFIFEQTGQELEEKDDLLVYVLRICIGTSEDQEDMVEALTRRSMPTEAAIKEAKATFQRPA